MKCPIDGSDLTMTERQGIEAFLGQKYNIAVPEPTSLGALALGGLLLARRRKSTVR